MVKRVHRDTLAPQRGGGPAARQDPHRVAPVGARAPAGCGPLVRAARTEDPGTACRPWPTLINLNPAADAEDRQPALPSGGEQGELEQVALPARRVRERRRLGAVPGGVHVFAARQQQAIGAIERAGRHGGADQRAEQDSGTPPAFTTELG